MVYALSRDPGPRSRYERGLEPDDWKPMATVGSGVKELRIREEAGAFRVIYLAKLAEAQAA